MPSKTRRNFLALLSGGIAIGLTGSAVASEIPEDTPLVVVNNQMKNEQSVTTKIRTAENEEVLIDDTQSIPAKGDVSYTDLPADKPLLITVGIDSGVEKTYRWASTAGENALGVGITSDQIGFEVATPP